MNASTVLQSFINYELIDAFDAKTFIRQEPFPWYNFHQFLTPQGFEALYQDFPPLELFEYHADIPRIHGQRPHNRYYLAYERSIYHAPGSEKPKGVIHHSELPDQWQQFLKELETSQKYHTFIKRLFQVPNFKVRYAWHVASNGCEVSPHMDTPEKIGTHILYFNTSEDWQPDWGGSTLVLSGKQTESLNPNVEDFAIAIPTQMIDNRSFLFKNAPNAWHGVEPLTCPDNQYRRLFNIIFEFPETPHSSQSKLLKPLKVLTQKVLNR